ncbi:MAG TPA: sugar phosphate isomerase/epimerase family protein [Rubrobacteraceae bacterium]|nr:sugar phosphate isomerase/epimerase family protein [Rubrobacteraceae bacterium]
MSVPVIFSTGSLYPFGLSRVFGWASAAGFDGVEVMMDERWDTHQAEYIEELAEGSGIPVLALHPPLYRGAWNLEPGETLVRVARLAQRLSVPVIVAHPPPPGRPLRRWVAGPIQKAREQGVAVCVENMPRNAKRRMFSVRRGNCHRPEDLVGLGDVTLDTSHLGASGEDPLRAWSVLGHQVRHIHLSDSRLSGKDEHRLPGHGKLPLRELLSAVGKSEYPGAVSLELKPWPLGAPDPETIQERMREALGFVREGLGGEG